MTEEDLAAHQADWVDPIRVDYRGYTLHEIPPNGQGIAALLMLGILDDTDLASHPVDSADSVHIQLEAMKLAFADARRYVSDPKTRDILVVMVTALNETGDIERAPVHIPESLT